MYIVAKFCTGFNTLIAYLQKRQQNEPQRLTFYLLNAIIANGMWEYARSTSHRQTSMRRVLIYFIAAIAAAFLWVLIISPTTYAADATWNSTSAIRYNSNDYRGPANEATTKSLGLTKGAQAYTYVDPAPTEVSTASTVRKIHVIFFTSADAVGAATSAKYKTYIYQGPSSFTNPSSNVDIVIDKQSAVSSKGTTSCDGSVFFSLGWILCPVTNLLANGVDSVFGILSGFLSVRPVTTGQDTALFRAWSYMRSFANVAFVISFLIIIYSQLTNFGIGNYGIKKLLPRLIIAALLVNLSFYICALAVDISNILGFSIQDVFINLRNGLVGTEGNNWGNLMSWKSVTGFILSGGTAAAVGITGAVIALSTYGIAGSIFLLLPALVSGLFAVLIALLIMSARQAIITILIIISPLAFVAYLLPNTEKWFEKWQSTFMTMLILFPAFSIVFGGSQLASAAIIQNADSINLIILGMLVQIAPLFITPLLIKLSGSMLGKIASLASSPNKGIVDRTRKFGEDRAGNIAAKRLAETVKKGQFMRKNAQRRDHNRRTREGWKSAHTGMADARWAKSNNFSNIDQAVREAGDNKAIGEGRSELRYNTRKTTAGKIQTLDTILRTTADKNTHIKAISDATYEIQKTEEYQKTAEFKSQSYIMRSLVTDSHVTAEGISIQAMRSQSAKNVQQNELGAALENAANVTLREEAGAGIIDPINGPQRARATAINVVSRAHAETIANASSIIDRGNLTDDKIIRLALGEGQIGTNGQPIDATVDIREAAIARIAGGGNVPAIMSLADQIDLSPEANEYHRAAFADSLKKNSFRPKYLGFGWMAQVAQGIDKGVGPTGIDNQIVNTVNAQKMSADSIVSQDPAALQRILDTMVSRPDDFKQPALEDLKKQIKTVYETDRYSGRIEDRDGALKAMLEEISRRENSDA